MTQYEQILKSLLVFCNKDGRPRYQLVITRSSMFATWEEGLEDSHVVKAIIYILDGKGQAIRPVLEQESVVPKNMTMQHTFQTGPGEDFLFTQQVDSLCQAIVFKIAKKGLLSL